MIASEFGWMGRRETSSFQGLSRGMICIAETMASAAAVLKSVGVVTVGTGPRMRPSWLIRSALPAVMLINIEQPAATPRIQPPLRITIVFIKGLTETAKAV